MDEKQLFPALTLADGTTFLLHATEPEAEETVKRLAELMCLGTASKGRRIFITVADKEAPRAHRSIPLPDRHEVPVCIIPPAEGSMAMGVIQTDTVAQRMAVLTLPDGGVLLHGALACLNGEGVILAAPGGTGKTTASNRFPPPWRSLSDDATLVVRDGKGNYFAHPWPTWSRLFNGETGCKWNVGEWVPLRAVFSLRQSDEDSAEPLEEDLALAFLMESFYQICGMKLSRDLDSRETEALTQMQFSAVEKIASVIPAFRLNISLTGRFWDVISEAIDTLDTTVEQTPVRKEDEEIPPAFSASDIDGDHIPIVVSGSSMLPTLRQPELLEVVPYGDEQPGPFIGDVICFFAPEKNYRVVHRVVSTSGDGVVTRGDNNPSNDPYTLTEQEIIGRVDFAWRNGERRKIPGRFQGAVTHRTLQARKKMLRLIAPGIRAARPVATVTRSLPRYFPHLMHQRVVLYTTRHRRILRLFFRRKSVGEFDARRGIWTIQYPYALFVDSTKLPTVEPVVSPHFRKQELTPNE